ncbi:MAG: helix-turn-helix transcriptional regulator [Bacteroidetes bacterium]|nr:helix-turn-helix transcriptional regulator [Bacteroidota bacterium]MBK8680393.1 helix-turn-helix transcriptional regulator [Bacteroidota bacterium]
MKTINETLCELREKKELLLREVALSISINPTLLSKIVRDERMPTKQQVSALAKFYKRECNEIYIAYLSDKIAFEMQDQNLALQAMKTIESKFKHQRKNRKV